MLHKKLNTEIAKEFIDKESPNSLNVQGYGITDVDDIDDERMKNLRRLDISFNLITSLRNITCQMPQLRQLSAYCCQLSDIDDLNYGSHRLEVIHLQQNGISSIPRAFQSFNKLKDLRLDRNKLINVTNLSCCTSLQHLNLSYNKLEKVDGLEGLQKLEVLILRNNNILTLKSIKLLPSLKELDVSYNNISSLEGIQNLPVLEILRAEYNEINNLQLPQTFVYGGNKKLTASDKNIKSTNDNKSNSKKSLKSESTTKSLKLTQTDGVTKSQTVVGGMRHLNEVHLSHNKISSLRGLESFGDNLEVIDFSSNLFDDEVILLEFFVDMTHSLDTSKQSTNQTFIKLAEIKIDENPFTINQSKEQLQNFIRRLLPCCPQLKTINDYILQFHPNTSDSITTLNKIDPIILNDQKVIHSLIDTRNFTLVYQDFHTWVDVDGQSEVDEKGISDSKAITTSNESTNEELQDDTLRRTSKNNNKNHHHHHLDSDSDDEIAHSDSDEELVTHNSKRSAPRLYLKNMKSIDDIHKKERDFQELLGNCRVALGNIMNQPTIKSSSSSSSSSPSLFRAQSSGSMNRNKSSNITVKTTKEIDVDVDIDEEAEPVIDSTNSYHGIKKQPLTARDQYDDPFIRGERIHAVTVVDVDITPISNDISLSTQDSHVYVESNLSSSSMKTVVKTGPQLDLKHRKEDPGLQLLQQRQLNYLSGNQHQNHRRLSNSSVMSTNAILQDKVISDTIKLEGNDHSFSRPLSAGEIMKAEPNFSIGFDVRLQKF